MNRVLIVGCGYTGSRLGGRLAAAGQKVRGTTRDPERARRLAAFGIEPLRVELSGPAAEGGLRALAGQAATDCFWLVPPPSPAPTPSAGPAAAVDPAARALDAFDPAPRTFVYVSSTSVYGNRDGGWVDEETDPAPDSPRGKARLAAESAVLERAARRGVRACVARPAGIYGPGRTLADRLEDGRYRLIDGSDAWSNRIHVDDLVEALVAIRDRGRPGAVYNVTDDRPHRSADYARFTADLLGIEPARMSRKEAEAIYSADRLARKLGSKRVSNRRLREELGVTLKYPSFEEGISASLPPGTGVPGFSSGQPSSPP